ncbi:MAG: hypothetical protein AB7F22_11520 [Reyranella sp.]|uniref:hypothetical protein n=1 Tax=Reyranella sp. TaxID=1929291 RepID=UPI003D136A13
MRRADRAKFEQNANLRALLLDTGSAELVEDSPHRALLGHRPGRQRPELGRTRSHGSEGERLWARHSRGASSV